MGTRGSVGFIYKETYKSTYNHFDSYPSGLGEIVVSFVNKVIAENGLEKLKEAVEKLELVSSEKEPTEEQIEKYKKFSNTGVSTGKLTEWYVLLRELQGGEILNAVYSGECSHMIDGNGFIQSSLWCEWAYVINLDKNQLEIYKGFQKEPDPKNRFGTGNDDGYYPCKMIKKFPISKVIPADAMKKVEKMRNRKK